jgi:hypothetical protein
VLAKLKMTRGPGESYSDGSSALRGLTEITVRLAVTLTMTD